MSREPTLVEQYAKCASRHGAATLAFNSDEANAAQADLVKRYRAIRSAGSLADLVPLLDSADPAVTSWAATHLLEVEPERALQALRRVAAGEGLVSFGARMVIKEWEGGTLQLER